MKFKVDPRRIRPLNNRQISSGPIIYWMSRDQRIKDNWALLYAQELAVANKQPLAVLFCLTPSFLGATIRQYGFMLAGLQEIEKDLAKLGIPFFLALGNPDKEIISLAKKIRPGVIVTDFDPLKIKRKWAASAAKKGSCAFFEVDAHNIVPCWHASAKREFGAYTLRPKINRLLPEFLTDFPRIKKQQTKWSTPHKPIDWGKILAGLTVNGAVAEVTWFKPGQRAAQRALAKFIQNGLGGYEKNRNDPNIDGQSNLSPYLHFGHISAQRVALAAKDASRSPVSTKAFLEELIIRRELSDNYCFYTPDYDSFRAFPAWAQKTLNEHRKDQREYTYKRADFERAKTHDDLWNAAQLQMATTGKMHGYMRMYWAKKILEWTTSPEDALKAAIYLNDTYELDGRDPNGYTGIAWSIGGVHDRAWGQRPVFGKIRYMSYNGCKSKFDVKQYIERFGNLANSGKKITTTKNRSQHKKSSKHNQ